MTADEMHEGPCCDACMEDYDLGYTDLGELDGKCCCRAVQS